ncbi:MAG: hypothetical protein ACXVXW_15425, partial [Mycobacteriaceae bacterium]
RLGRLEPGLGDLVAGRPALAGLTAPRPRPRHDEAGRPVTLDREQPNEAFGEISARCRTRRSVRSALGADRGVR